MTDRALVATLRGGCYGFISRWERMMMEVMRITETTADNGTLTFLVERPGRVPMRLRWSPSTYYFTLQFLHRGETEWSPAAVLGSAPGTYPEGVHRRALETIAAML